MNERKRKVVEVRERGIVMLDSFVSSVGQRISKDSDNRLVSRFRIFADMLIYLFGREGTILISSIAFNFFVSLFPIIILLLTLTDLLGWSGLRESVFEVLGGFFPISQDFIVRNLRIYTRGLGPPQILSVLLIAWAGSTLFFALEAGLDSAYRIKAARRFVHSQVVGTGMTILAGGLVFAAIALFGSAKTWLDGWESLRPQMNSGASLVISFLLLVLLLFALYFGLPNFRQPPKLVLRASIFGSVTWMLFDHIFRLFAGSMSLQSIYGPFYVSMTLLLWAYSSGCVVLGAARLAADGFFGKGGRRRKQVEERLVEEVAIDDVDHGDVAMEDGDLKEA